jgi:prevent-host-death family protein
METVNMHEAKTHFSKLIAQVEEGGTVVIAKAGKPVARIVPIAEPSKAALPELGFLKGQFKAPPDIKKAFEDEINEMFYGK